jgi:hypothetical protein
MKRKPTKDDVRTRIIHKFLLLTVEYPNWRCGQIFANAVREFDGRVDCDPFYIDDEELELGLDNLLDECKQLDNYENNK